MTNFLNVEERALHKIENMNYLFVYGTLLAKEGNKMSDFLESNAVLTGTGYFQGKLFSTGEYPGAVLSCNRGDKVYGNIYKINNPDKVFRVLDIYEETGPEFPEHNEYKRQQITAFLSGTTTLTCWVYLYNCPTSGLKQIYSGDYSQIRKM